MQKLLAAYLSRAMSVTRPGGSSSVLSSFKAAAAKKARRYIGVPKEPSSAEFGGSQSILMRGCKLSHVAVPASKQAWRA
jgi:hypothetical protein